MYTIKGAFSNISLIFENTSLLHAYDVFSEVLHGHVRKKHLPTAEPKFPYNPKICFVDFFMKPPKLISIRFQFFGEVEKVSSQNVCCFLAAVAFTHSQMFWWSKISLDAVETDEEILHSLLNETILMFSVSFPSAGFFNFRKSFFAVRLEEIRLEWNKSKAKKSSSETQWILINGKVSLGRSRTRR